MDTSESFNIRFAGIINSLDYKKVGYEIKVSEHSKMWENDSQTVYKSLKGTTSDGTPITAVSAEKLGGEYIAAVVIKNVPSKTSIVFEISPYVINVNGERVYGESWNVIVNSEGEIRNEKL